jgi:hypothetical protein
LGVFRKFFEKYEISHQTVVFIEATTKCQRAKININLFEILFNPYFVTFSLFWAEKTHFREGRHENKEKRLFYHGLRILWPI